MKRYGWAKLLPALALALLTTACGDDDPAGPGTQAVPDFLRVDVNPFSATYGDPVSPRDYLQVVSAWYFGHAT
ncbi:MAG: hypothetical protein IPK64_02935 [bacterium]|nr:hypothetical protein [bacterium]